MNRALLLLAGFAGAAGVALSARAAHVGGGNLQTAANMLLAHAPALLALALTRHGARLPAITGVVLGLGMLLFSGDLVARDMLGSRLFPMAAPAGGLLMIAAWLLVAAMSFRRNPSS